MISQCRSFSTSLTDLMTPIAAPYCRRRRHLDLSPSPPHLNRPAKWTLATSSNAMRQGTPSSLRSTGLSCAQRARQTRPHERNGQATDRVAATTLSVWTNTEDCATRAAEASVSTCSPISQNFSRRTAILRCSNAPALKHCYNGCAKLRTHHSEQFSRTLTRRTVALNTRDC